MGYYGDGNIIFYILKEIFYIIIGINRNKGC